MWEHPNRKLCRNSELFPELALHCLKVTSGVASKGTRQSAMPPVLPSIRMAGHLKAARKEGCSSSRWSLKQPDIQSDLSCHFQNKIQGEFPTINTSSVGCILEWPRGAFKTPSAYSIARWIQNLGGRTWVFYKIPRWPQICSKAE